MKKITILMLIFTVALYSFGQQTTNNPSSLIKQNYLQKSKKLSKTGLILLGSGTTLFVAGIIAYLIKKILYFQQLLGALIYPIGGKASADGSVIQIIVER